MEQSADDGSKLDIRLYYGGTKPVLTIKCDPEKRSIFLGVNAASDTANNSYRSVTVLNDIEGIRFVEYVAEVPGGVETDMLVSVRDSGRGLHGGGMVVSKHAHGAVF